MHISWYMRGNIHNLQQLLSSFELYFNRYYSKQEWWTLTENLWEPFQKSGSGSCSFLTWSVFLPYRKPKYALSSVLYLGRVISGCWGWRCFKPAASGNCIYLSKVAMRHLAASNFTPSIVKNSFINSSLCNVVEVIPLHNLLTVY